jgi:hypothetical protein
MDRLKINAHRLVEKGVVAAPNAIKRSLLGDILLLLDTENTWILSYGLI